MVLLLSQSSQNTSRTPCFKTQWFCHAAKNIYLWAFLFLNHNNLFQFRSLKVCSRLELQINNQVAKLMLCSKLISIIAKSNVKIGQAFHSQGTLGAKPYITQNSNWKIISYKSNEKNIYLIFWSVTQLHSYLVWEISRVTQLHNYIIHWLGKIIGKNICLIFWCVTQ